MDSPRTAYLRNSGTVTFFTSGQQQAFINKSNSTHCAKPLLHFEIKLNNGQPIHCGAVGET
jgi:hypothetical protein